MINFEIAQRSSAQNVVAFRINPFKGLVIVIDSVVSGGDAVGGGRVRKNSPCDEPNKNFNKNSFK